MTIRNLRYMFAPSSIAIIGASKTPASVGRVLAHNLFGAGFDGPIMPVNPRHAAVEGVLTYPDVASLPVTPDLAIIATPSESVPGLIDALGRRGTRAAVVITAGFGELAGAQGKDLERAMLAAARPHLLRIVGPNCLGIMVPARGVNASFAHLRPGTGSIAFAAQSGAIVTAMLDWAASRGIGFSKLVSLGDMVDVDFGDMLDYLADDPDTRAILLYIEAVTHARKFMSAARAAARSKPVIVVKAGRSAEGARAATSHTGALAGADAVYDAVFRRAGMLRVHTLEELFNAVELLSLPALPRGDRLAILTNGGGIGVMATDALVAEGGRLAPLSPETLRALDAVLPPTWSRGNPVDIIGDAPGARYAAALDVLLASPDVDALLVLNCPTGITSPADAARAVVDTRARSAHPALLTSWVGAGAADQARQLFAAHRIPTYATPEQAVRAFMYMVNYRRSQDALMETPPSQPGDLRIDRDRVRAVVHRALAAERAWLDEREVAEVLEACGIPTVPARTATTPAEAAEAAAALAHDHPGPLVLKIRSPDVVHKSDVGGVMLGLDDPRAVGEAAERMLARVRKAVPGARVDGFTVASMIRRPHAYELFLGATVDPQFGPVIVFGHGGTAVEVIDDKALGLPPLNMRLARELMSRTRIHRLLQGYRDQPAVDLDAVAVVLIRLAQLVIDIPEVTELDINPLLADAGGAIALDARVRVAHATVPGTRRLAIRPYPSEIEETIALPDGRALLIRPILPEDEPALQAGFAKLTPEQVRLRFFIPLKTLTHVMAARFTQIDYDRDMVLVLTERGIPGKTEIYGVVSLNADPDGERGEYAIVVRADMTGKGLGLTLMHRIIDYARARGIKQIFGDVLRENHIMRKICRELGFREEPVPDDPTLLRVLLPVQ